MPIIYKKSAPVIRRQPKKKFAPGAQTASNCTNKNYYIATGKFKNSEGKLTYTYKKESHCGEPQNVRKLTNVNLAMICGHPRTAVTDTIYVPRDIDEGNPGQPNCSEG